MSSKADLAVLLEQTGWTRALARSLAADPHLAEDLVQDAWVAALERPPDLGRPVRGWLARVLRNRWLDLTRARGRVRERERLAASDEAWPSSHEVVERAALQRELVAAVLDLDEPYRTTVLLRFFEDLPQREIARRMRTTPATVNSRLTRGLARLRERMTRRAGWARALVLLLGEPRSASALALGAGAMKALVTSIVLVVSLVVGLFLWTRPAEPGGQALVQGPASLDAPPLEQAEESHSVEPPPVPNGERVPVASEALPRVTTVRESPIPVQRRVRGRVLDANGSSVPGIELALAAQGSRARATSDASGSFEIALDVPARAIVCADARYATVLAGSALVREATRALVVIAPRIALSGSVVDEARRPQPGAEVALDLPAGFGAEWGMALDYSLPQRWRTTSASDGRFGLAAVPAIEGARLRAVLAGFSPCATEAPLRSTEALELVLARPEAWSGLVRGVVLEPEGGPAAGAYVSAGAEIARADERGGFTLDLRAEGAGARLIALAPGLLPAVFEPPRAADGEAAWPAEVVLRLGARAGTLRGRVVDDDGGPVGGAKVWLDDPTSFGRTSDARLTVEALLGRDPRFWSFVVTDSDGTFAIEGLLERAYRLEAVDPRTLVGVASGPVTVADSPVELRLPTRDLCARVAGHVVSAGGRPIAGVSVRLYRLTFELEHEGGVDNESEQREPVVTGEDGAFEFRDVPWRDLDLVASGDTILSAGTRLAEEPDLLRVELVASLRVHLQVELDEPRDRADRLRVFDADEHRVLLSVFHGAGANASFDAPLVDGRSEVISVEERAATVVLYRGEVEVARLPLRLVPGQTNVVRY